MLLTFLCMLFLFGSFMHMLGQFICLCFSLKLMSNKNNCVCACKKERERILAKFSVLSFICCARPVPVTESSLIVHC